MNLGDLVWMLICPLDSIGEPYANKSPQSDSPSHQNLSRFSDCPCFFDARVSATRNAGACHASLI